MSNAPTITCEEALRLLADYLDGELEPSEHSSVERHLEICRGCFSRAEFERLLGERLALLASESPSPDFSERIRAIVERFTL